MRARLAPALATVLLLGGCASLKGAQPTRQSPSAQPMHAPVTPPPASTETDKGVAPAGATPVVPGARIGAPPLDGAAPAAAQDGDLDPDTQSSALATPENDGWELGIASYYANAFVGRRTANGERYQHTLETCAHRTAPFGTTLEVERRDTGVRVRCRVNDRGPWVQGRVVDVSRSLARKLDLLGVGLVEVRVRPVPE